jgi:hypothetical protein
METPPLGEESMTLGNETGEERDRGASGRGWKSSDSAFCKLGSFIRGVVTTGEAAEDIRDMEGSTAGNVLRRMLRLL